MKLRKINNKGFSHVEMVIVVLVVAVLGLVGWRVLKNTSHAGSNCTGQTLKLGVKGDCVSDVQNLLYAFNITKADIAITGTFTKNTNVGVLAFQQNVFAGDKTKWSGFVDSNTWTRLCSLNPTLQTWPAYHAQLNACGKTNINPKGASSSGPLGFNWPASLNIGSDGMLWVTNQGHSIEGTAASVEKINPTTGKVVFYIHNFGDPKGGPVSFPLWWANDSTLDSAGNLYVSGINVEGNPIVKINSDGSGVTTLNSPSITICSVNDCRKGGGLQSTPYSLALINSVIYAATGIRSNGSATLGYLNKSSKTEYFDMLTQGVEDSNGLFNGYGSQMMAIQKPTTSMVAWLSNPANDSLIAVNLINKTQTTYDNSSQPNGLGLSGPGSLAVDNNGKLWVINGLGKGGPSSTNTLTVLDISGKKPTFVKLVSLGVNLDFHAKLAAYGNYLWVSDPKENKMFQININTGSVKTLDNSSGNYAFNGNGSMTVDSKGNLFVANSFSNTITELNANTGALIQVLN